MEEQQKPKTWNDVQVATVLEALEQARRSQSADALVLVSNHIKEHLTGALPTEIGLPEWIQEALNARPGHGYHCTNCKKPLRVVEVTCGDCRCEKGVDQALTEEIPQDSPAGAGGDQAAPLVPGKPTVSPAEVAQMLMRVTEMDGKVANVYIDAKNLLVDLHQLARRLGDSDGSGQALDLLRRWTHWFKANEQDLVPSMDFRRLDDLQAETLRLLS